MVWDIENDVMSPTISAMFYTTVLGALFNDTTDDDMSEADFLVLEQNGANILK